ncbi:hypothetical protein NC652_012503 [Populus alba x Populus x berolinensis]|nr:hypothetical protein NC652_012503 [Populus alba x Populus x berolinensis]
MESLLGVSNNYDEIIGDRLQNVFKETRGGLSPGLAEKILGTGLNKGQDETAMGTLRASVSQLQLEYAALDAAVLVPHISSFSQSTLSLLVSQTDMDKIEWKSHIVSRMDNPKKAKKESKNKRGIGR